MNKLTLAALIALAGCATYYQPAPNHGALELRVGSIRIINEQLETEPRVFFTDGITTIKTEYRGWTEVISTQFEKWLSTSAIKSPSEKTLGLSLQSITCNGHFIRSCALSLAVSRGDGTRKLYTTDTYMGYTDALEKAVEGVVELALSDADLLDYLKK